MNVVARAFCRCVQNASTLSSVRQSELSELAPVDMPLKQLALRRGGRIAQSARASENRSSCDSGSGKVPTCSCGFWRGDDEETDPATASTGRPASPAALPWLPSSALCALGDARLISSARTSCAKIGPALETELAGFAVEYRHSQYVGGQQVARELNPLKGLSPRRLGDVRGRAWSCRRPECPRSAKVAARQQARQAQAYLRILAQNDAIQLRRGPRRYRLPMCRLSQVHVVIACSSFSDTLAACCGQLIDLGAQFRQSRSRSFATTSGGRIPREIQPLASLVSSLPQIHFRPGGGCFAEPFEFGASDRSVPPWGPKSPRLPTSATAEIGAV